MPVIQCPNGKWRIGDGPCLYETREQAERVWRAILAQREKQKRRGQTKER
jgi:hypothetical protein